MQENNVNNIIRLLSDQVNSVRKLDIYSEDSVYTPNYYQKVLESIGVNLNQYIKTMNDIIAAGKSMGEEYRAKASFYDLYLYPIKNNLDLRKNYSDYNINIEFFSQIRNINSSSITNGEYGHMYQLDTFKFTRNKLSSFTLHNIDNGMKYRYNSKYDLDVIIFVDGSELKVDINKKSKK